MHSYTHSCVVVFFIQLPSELFVSYYFSKDFATVCNLFYNHPSYISSCKFYDHCWYSTVSMVMCSGNVPWQHDQLLLVYDSRRDFMWFSHNALAIKILVDNEVCHSSILESKLIPKKKKGRQLQEKTTENMLWKKQINETGSFVRDILNGITQKYLYPLQWLYPELNSLTNHDSIYQKTLKIHYHLNMIYF